MNVIGLVIAAVLIGVVLYLFWKVATDIWKSKESLFLLLRFSIVASFLALIAYVIYQNFDVGDLLMGLLWLTLGIVLLAALLATIEKLEQKFRKDDGGDDGSDSLSS